VYSFNIRLLDLTRLRKTWPVKLKPLE
jgi:hypothetical protein